MIAFLLALVLWMVGQGRPPVPAPAAAAHAVAPAAVAPAAAAAVHSPHPPALPRPRTGGAGGTVAAPPSAPAPVIDPAHPDYQPQLPEEVIGRQETGANGEECVVIDVELHMSCTPAPAAGP